VGTKGGEAWTWTRAIEKDEYDFNEGVWEGGRGFGGDGGDDGEAGLLV